MSTSYFGQSYKNYVNQKKATEKFAPKHLYGLRCIFSCVWNDRLLRGDGPIGLVLAPTRELAMQIYAEAKKFGKVYDLQVNFYLRLFLWESIFIF